MGRFHKRWALVAVVAALLLVSPIVALAAAPVVDGVDVSVSLGRITQVDLGTGTCEVTVPVTVEDLGNTPGTLTYSAVWYLSSSGNVPGNLGLTVGTSTVETFFLEKGSDGVIVASALATGDVNLRNNVDRQRLVINCR